MCRKDWRSGLPDKESLYFSTKLQWRHQKEWDCQCCSPLNFLHLPGSQTLKVYGGEIHIYPIAKLSHLWFHCAFLHQPCITYKWKNQTSFNHIKISVHGETLRNVLLLKFILKHQQWQRNEMRLSRGLCIYHILRNSLQRAVATWVQ